MTTQTFRCLDRVADLILLRVGEKTEVEETFAAVAKRERLEFEHRVKSEWKYQSMIIICEGLTQSLRIKNEVQIFSVVNRKYVFDDNNEITFLLMGTFISIYGSVPKTAVSGYDNGRGLFEFTDGGADLDASCMFFKLKVNSQYNVNNALSELLRLFSCYKKRLGPFKAVASVDEDGMSVGKCGVFCYDGSSLRFYTNGNRCFDCVVIEDQLISLSENVEKLMSVFVTMPHSNIIFSVRNASSVEICNFIVNEHPGIMNKIINRDIDIRGTPLSIKNNLDLKISGSISVSGYTVLFKSNGRTFMCLDADSELGSILDPTPTQERIDAKVLKTDYSSFGYKLSVCSVDLIIFGII
jgi:hypothetical protein